MNIDPAEAVKQAQQARFNAITAAVIEAFATSGLGPKRDHDGSPYGDDEYEFWTEELGKNRQLFVCLTRTTGEEHGPTLVMDVRTSDDQGPLDNYPSLTIGRPSHDLAVNVVRAFIHAVVRRG